MRLSNKNLFCVNKKNALIHVISSAWRLKKTDYYNRQAALVELLKVVKTPEYQVNKQTE